MCVCVCVCGWVCVCVCVCVCVHVRACERAMDSRIKILVDVCVLVFFGQFEAEGRVMVLQHRVVVVQHGKLVVCVTEERVGASRVVEVVDHGRDQEGSHFHRLQGFLAEGQDSVKVVGGAKGQRGDGRQLVVTRTPCVAKWS